jgi:tetratricopeptide (TPR) repeat protein
LPRTDPAALLAGAAAPRSRPQESAAAIARAVAAAPDDIQVRLAAYRFHFFAHAHAQAAEEATALLRLAARRLNIPADPAQVRPGDAEFTAHDFAPGLYLQALIGLGYCAARSGQPDLARAMLAKAAELDPTDRFGGAWLLRKLDQPSD